MKLQVIEDAKGKAAGVFIPIAEWNQLKKQYKDLEKLESPSLSKSQLLKELQQAVNELTLIQAGKLKPRAVKALLDEL